MSRLIIEIRGGLLASVVTDAPIEIVVVDWDAIKAGGEMQNWSLAPCGDEFERRLAEVTAEVSQ